MKFLLFVALAFCAHFAQIQAQTSTTLMNISKDGELKPVATVSSPLSKDKLSAAFSLSDQAAAGFRAAFPSRSSKLSQMDETLAAHRTIYPVFNTAGILTAFETDTHKVLTFEKAGDKAPTKSQLIGTSTNIESQTLSSPSTKPNLF